MLRIWRRRQQYNGGEYVVVGNNDGGEHDEDDWKDMNDGDEYVGEYVDEADDEDERTRWICFCKTFSPCIQHLSK
jgi:hypothetical protein